MKRYGSNLQKILMLATNAQEHAPETGTSHLVPETCMYVGQSGTSFFLIQVSCTK